MSLKDLSAVTIDIIGDYQNNLGVSLTSDNVVMWAEQFDKDAEFVLTELNGILSKTYISRIKAKRLLKSRLDSIMLRLKYRSMLDLIKTVHFFDLQPDYKSQKAILVLLDEVLMEEYGLVYGDYALYTKTNFIYFDDILATGNTIREDLLEWLLEMDNEKPHFRRVIDGDYRLIVSCFCFHSHGFGLMKWALMCNTDKGLDKKWIFMCDIEITDHPMFNNQNYNCIMPLSDNVSERAINYLNNLSADKQERRAFRPNNQPTVETFFSSSENRQKFEHIFVEKGLDILEKVGHISSNQRPLGMTYPSHKTFGMGTLFFTWRNIPNNCPILFWWENHGWKPLFPLQNRGK